MDPSGPKPLSDGDWAQPPKHRGGTEHSQLGLGCPCADPGQSPEPRKRREDVFTGSPPALLTPSPGAPSLSRAKGKGEMGFQVQPDVRNTNTPVGFWRAFAQQQQHTPTPHT